MSPHSHVVVVKHTKMPEPNRIGTYVEYVNFLSLLKRLKPSVTPSEANEKYSLREIETFSSEEYSGKSSKKPTVEKGKCKPEIESSSTGNETGVSIDVDISLEREAPPAPLTPIIIIANRNPVEVIDSHSQAVAVPTTKKKKRPSPEKRHVSSRATPEIITDLYLTQRPLPKQSMFYLGVASAIYVLTFFVYLLYKRFYFTGVDTRVMNVTQIIPHLDIFQTNKTDVFDMINDTASLTSLL
ncbi:uncharacterized protein LOC129961767 [Argiope bruennichi]|uniref:uncharacterized protein LOC129961767 n=1 Tax=Argiope bruennichi TaxID=94029 RepID=UPI0024951D3F|nr:uncharacterized protein LOC129961767 [Argiope bruennichi]